MWDMVIGHQRANGDNRQIEMLYTDLASNDFSTLFRMMQGMQGDPDHAYQSHYDNVFVHGCGTGFHQQLMADGSLNLGFSATAMHYVSVKPMELPTHLHSVCADPESRAAYAQQAAEDWENILLARAAELMPGGRFICLNFGAMESRLFYFHRNIFSPIALDCLGGNESPPVQEIPYVLDANSCIPRIIT